MDKKTEVVKFLTLKGEPCKTLTISQAVGFKTRKDINPILYELLKEGILQKTSKNDGSQPHWFISSEDVCRPDMLQQFHGPFQHIQASKNCKQDFVVNSTRKIENRL